MKESFDEKGVWTFEAFPKLEFQGSLGWTPDSGARLVIRVLDQEMYRHFAKLLGGDVVVCGRLQRRPFVTLSGAKVVSISGNQWDAEVTISATRLLRGSAPKGHWDNLIVKDLSVAFSGLNQWADYKAFKISEDAKALRLESDKRIESLFYEDEICRVYVSHSHRTSHSQFRFSIESVTKFEIRPKGQSTFKSVKQLADAVRAYLTIALDTPVVCESASLIFDDEIEASGSLGIPDIYDLYEQVDAGVFDLCSKRYNTQRALFMLSPEADSMAAFSRFQTLYKKYPAIFDFYLAQTYGRESYLYQQFCDMTFGLEGLHRALHGGFYLDKNDYKLKVLCLIRHSIPKWISGLLESSIRNRMDGANSYTLRSRILDLMERHKDCAQPYIGDAELFAKAVVGMRNDIAHAKRGLPKDEAGQLRIAGLLYRVRLLFQLELLTQLGFSSSHISARVPSLMSASLCRRYQI